MFQTLKVLVSIFCLANVSLSNSALSHQDGYSFSGPGHFVMRQFYCKNPQSKAFLQQFLTHYFSILDSEKRHLLFGLYHSEALFSITSTFLAGQSTSTNAK
jgi:hypothetical protein